MWDKKGILLRSILEDPAIRQRELCKKLDASLGSVNKLWKECVQEGLIEEEARRQCADASAAGRGKEAARHHSLTERGLSYLAPERVDCALILSAGFGSRFVPLTYETPKGLLRVQGEPMIERQIRQLHEVGVTDITIMVGYLKEKFEYLQDKFGVKLIYNPEYSVKNTLATIYHARSVLEGKNCYILSSDNWLRENVYHTYEPAAWYCGSHAEGKTAEWVLITDKKGRITETYPGGRDCNYMYGPAYFSREFTASFLPVLCYYYEMPGTEQYYWEHVLMEILNGQAKKRLTAYFGREAGEAAAKGVEMYFNFQPDGVIYEFENLEELRAFDPKYENDSGSKAMQLVSRVFGVPESHIRKIRCLKAGMTNNSWLFSLDGSSYICRIPGEGTDKLINRKEEKAVYEAVGKLGITERLIYFDEKSGYKISRYYEGARNADPKNEADLSCCMKRLRELHESGISVAHHFDISKRIDRYEMLCVEAARQNGALRTEEGDTADTAEAVLSAAIPFKDYLEVRKEKERLTAWLSAQKRPEALAHIDAVLDNFIFLPGADLSETERDLSRLRLIDWEYAGMCDPLIDIGMCAIYSFMDEERAWHLAELYFARRPSEEEMRIIFAYMALGGLLWSLWGVYKEALGVQFTDYTIKMYQYFKHFSKKVK